jgi:hypothetical protein
MERHHTSPPLTLATPQLAHRSGQSPQFWSRGRLDRWSERAPSGGGGGAPRRDRRTADWVPTSCQIHVTHDGTWTRGSTQGRPNPVIPPTKRGCCIEYMYRGSAKCRSGAARACIEGGVRHSAAAIFNAPRTHISTQLRRSEVPYARRAPLLRLPSRPIAPTNPWVTCRYVFGVHTSPKSAGFRWSCPYVHRAALPVAPSPPRRRTRKVGMCRPSPRRW